MKVAKEGYNRIEVMDPVMELKSPLMVDFEITSRCPYKCFFCEGDVPNIGNITELSTKECFQVFEKLANAEVFNVFLTGGEPFFRSDLPDLVRHCFDVGLEPSVSTNAFFLDEVKIEKISKAGFKHLQISIQGPNIIHESIVKKPGSYLVVMKNLKKVIEAGIDVEVVCVGLKENLEHIPNLIRDVASVGVKYFRILRYVPAHRREMLEHIPPKKLVEDAVPKIQEVAKECNVDLLLSFCPGLIASPSYLFEGFHPVTSTCPAGKTEFTILPNGDVYPCTEFKNKQEMYIGNILSSSVAELWNHPKMVMLRKLTPADYTGICGQCERKWTCYSARCVAYNLTGDLYGDDLSCYMVREKLGLEG